MDGNEDDYVGSFLRARQNASIAQAKLAKIAQDLARPESERAAALAAFLQATEDIADLEAAHELMMARFGTVNPPSDATVAEAGRLATESGQVIATARTVSAILGAIVALLDGWQKL